jgi:methyl-accepting chemotaxis protein
MKKWYRNLSLTGKLVFGFVIVGIALILLCLLALNGVWHAFTFSAVLQYIVIAGLFLICFFTAFITTRYFKKSVAAYIVGLTAGMNILADGNLSYFDNDPDYDKNSKDETVRQAYAFVQLVHSAREKVADARQIAEGDLTTHIHVRCDKDELGNALLELVHNMHRVVSAISSAAEQVSSGSNLVADSSFSLSQGATEQASSIQQLTASLVEIASQTNLNAKNAEKANEFAQKAKTNAATGNSHMKGMLSAMDEINASSSNIGRIIKVIDDIAFQTNILALNAAVEAARAGQHGKGFAVVAEEVRNLAGKSANAAKETTDMIEGSMRKVEAGTKIANDTADALSQIASQVDIAADLIHSIAQASNEQAHAIEQINGGIQQVSRVVSTNAATSEESAAASEELSSQAAQLKESVSVFKLKRSQKQAGSLRQRQPGKLAETKATSPTISLGSGDFGKY